MNEPAKATRNPQGYTDFMIESAGGVEHICHEIINGRTFLFIADSLAIDVAGLLRWIAKEPDRTALMRQARVMAADTWDALAEETIRQAEDKQGLSVARELAHHYRWRASKICPKDYGDKPIEPAASKQDNTLVIEGGLPDGPCPE